MKTWGIFSLLLLIQFSACKKKEEAAKTSDPAPAALTKQSEAVEKPREKVVYVYQGERFRDPFTPAGYSTSYKPDAVFEPQRISVRGIIYGPQRKAAVLSMGGTTSYFVKGGRIFDVMGKTIDGFSAKVFANKVVLEGEGSTVFELKLRGSEEGDKT